MNYLVCNDIHIGTKRASGTTPRSQASLGDYLHSSFKSLLSAHTDKSVIINGDLFDQFNVDGVDLIRCYETLSDWLHDSKGRLVLVAGNHDWSPKAAKISSFGMLCHFLQSRFGERVQVVDHNSGFTRVDDRVWAIPHMPNQDLFDVEIDKAIASGEGGMLLLHCNVMSTFAERSDHSLNISDEQIRNLKNFRLIIGHEHQGRSFGVGETIVDVVGNQFPSSVSDCLAHGNAQRDGLKRAIVIGGDLGVSSVETWDAIGSFVEVDWRNLPLSIHQFVRVIGDASVEEAAEVVNAIAKFRARSDAFVITNAVKIEGVQGMDDLAEMSFDEIQKFDVLQALLDTLSEDEARVVKGVLNAQTT